ncbi:MAG TPA: acetylxylan esterase [Bryobacteraceae bacterium]|nr:acetylxylan esterase [Bryobacteraceae bacterium]
MTRRTALTLALSALNTPAEIRYRQYARCLPDYIARLAREAHTKRNTDLAKLTTPAAIADRQQWVTDTFWKLTGSKPDNTPLNIKTTGAFDRPAYRVEKLVYESQPGLHIPANLYIPKNHKPPFPGVLFQMGHSLNGKAAEPYQKCCQALAQLGYLVLAFDPMGQGERTYYPQPNGGVLTRLGSADDEHTRPGKQMLLVGDTATRMQAWDAVRSLDVLASHPLVDKTRLGSTGQSGGGTLTMFLTAVDNRLASAAISCGNTENFATENFNPPGSVDDAEQDFVNAGPLGFDRWDLVYPMAPKPMLIGVSARDYFGTYSPSYLNDGRAEFTRLKNIYRTLGKEGAIEWFETPLPHALSHDMRLQIYSFFERTLKNSSSRITQEPSVKPEPDDQLYAGLTANVVRDFKSKTPLSLARERAATLKRPGIVNPIDIPIPKNTSINVLGTASGETGAIEAVEVQVSPEMYLPGYIFKPKSEPTGVIIVLEPRGRNAHWREDDLYPKLAASGRVVAAFDIRGIGDLWPEVGRGNPFYTRRHAEEDSYAWASLMLGQPMLHQRVTDILAIVEAMRKYTGEPILLAALDHLTVPALFATMLNPSIWRLYTARGLPSYAGLLESEDYNEPFANFFPNILSMIDLPQIRSALAQRLHQGKTWDFETLSSLAANGR